MSSDNDQSINDLYVSNMRLGEDRDRWRHLCLELSEVVKSDNRLPVNTSTLVSKQRKEWPELWSAIDKIVEAR